jgi:putative ABC transport system permease protein
VGDVRHYGLDSDPADELYAPFAQVPVREGSLLIRTTGEPLAVARRIEDEVHAIDPAQPVANIASLEELRSKSLASSRVTASLLGLFALLALLITGAGLAGVIAFSVSQRTQEIGVRMALGAERAKGVGDGAAGGCAWCWRPGPRRRRSGAHPSHGRALCSVPATDPLTFASVTLLLVAVAAMACLVPARRAAAVDPLVALRST